MTGYEYRGVLGRRARRRCPHSDLRGIFGDEVNHVGGWRLLCLGCGRFLDGPVWLASLRAEQRRPESPRPRTPHPTRLTWRGRRPA